jgi:radical SAM protein with 4Fe4S-binding SPASM domain
MPRSQNKTAPDLPGTFVFELTRRCNHHCSYCYTFWGVDVENQGNAGKDLTLPAFTRFMEKLIDDVQVKNVAFSGGEPLLNDDLFRMVDYLHNKNISSAIISNGTLITPEIAAKLSSADIVEITLLSCKPEIHDDIVRKHGAWKAAVQGIANLFEAKGYWEAVFIATKKNIAFAGETAKLAIALGAEGMMFNRINVGRHNMTFADDLLPSPEMISNALYTLDGISEKYGFPIVVSVPIEPCLVDISPFKHIHFGFCPLGGSSSYFTIDPSGDIRLCNHSPVVLGNLDRDSFLDIYSNHSYVRSFREDWPEECRQCDPELKDLCKGGCKAAAAQCYNTMDTVDPFVRYWLKKGAKVLQPA